MLTILKMNVRRFSRSSVFFRSATGHCGDRELWASIYEITAVLFGCCGGCSNAVESDSGLSPSPPAAFICYMVAPPSCGRKSPRVSWKRRVPMALVWRYLLMTRGYDYLVVKCARTLRRKSACLQCDEQLTVCAKSTALSLLT